MDGPMDQQMYGWMDRPTDRVNYRVASQILLIFTDFRDFRDF